MARVRALVIAAYVYVDTFHHPISTLLDLHLLNKITPIYSVSHLILVYKCARDLKGFWQGIRLTFETQHNNF